MASQGVSSTQQHMVLFHRHVADDVDYVPSRSKLADLHHLDHWDVCSVGVCYSLLQNRSRVSSSKKVL